MRAIYVAILTVFLVKNARNLPLLKFGSATIFSVKPIPVGLFVSQVDHFTGLIMLRKFYVQLLSKM